MARRTSVTDMAYSQDEFGLESRHLDLLVWDNLAIEAGNSVLFCGFGPDGALVRKAVQAKAKVTVIETHDEAMRKFANLGARILRGSTSVIPAKNDAFDVAVAHHYLHEVDPFFHSQVVFELGRVGKRVVIIEPAPPTDPLGKRISMLYSRAKRELGQFEYYQTLEYWKKLLALVKGEVATTVLAFTKMPPREYLNDTVELLLDTMKIEEAPQFYLDQLREIAEKSDSPLLPQPRYILVGAATGEIPAIAPRERAAPPPRPEEIAAAAVKRLRGTKIDTSARPREYALADNEPVLPDVAPAPAGFAPPAPQQPPAAAPQTPAPFAIPPPALPFGAPAPPAPPQPDVQHAPQPAAPFGFPTPGQPFPPPFAPLPLPGAPPAAAPFGLPNAAAPGAGGTGIDQPPAGWRWEPPEDDEE